MLPEFEAWRTAAELALGGFAVTMLVDRDCSPACGAASTPWRCAGGCGSRGSPRARPAGQQPGASILPGRCQFRDSAFTGWLTNTLVARFGYTCVEIRAELDSRAPGSPLPGRPGMGSGARMAVTVRPMSSGSPTRGASARSPSRSRHIDAGLAGCNARRTAMTSRPQTSAPARRPHARHRHHVGRHRRRRDRRPNSRS